MAQQVNIDVEMPCLFKTSSYVLIGNKLSVLNTNPTGENSNTGRLTDIAS